MPSATSDHRLKLKWAKRHLAGLLSSIKRFTKRKPYEFHGTHDERSGKYVGRLSRVDPVPYDWSLRVADAVHCIRSSLDVLVYQLAVKHHGSRTLKGEELLRLQFVIASHAAEYRELAAKHLTLVSPEVRDAIARLQTYTGPHSKLANGLVVLRAFSNTDKHRLLVPTLATARDARILAHVPGEKAPRVLATYSGPIKQGVRVLTARSDHIAALQRRGAEFSATLSFEVRFANTKPALGGNAHELLSKAIRYCEHDAFPALERFL